MSPVAQHDGSVIRVARVDRRAIPHGSRDDELSRSSVQDGELIFITRSQLARQDHSLAAGFHFQLSLARHIRHHGAHRRISCQLHSSRLLLTLTAGVQRSCKLGHISAERHDAPLSRFQDAAARHLASHVRIARLAVLSRHIQCQGSSFYCDFSPMLPAFVLPAQREVALAILLDAFLQRQFHASVQLLTALPRPVLFSRDFHFHAVGAVVRIHLLAHDVVVVAISRILQPSSVEPHARIAAQRSLLFHVQ